MRPSLERETVHMLHFNLIIGGNQEFVERLQYSAPQRDFGHLRDWTKQIDTSIKIVRTQARRQPVVIATDPKNHVGMCMRSLRLNMRGKFPFRLVGDAIVERERSEEHTSELQSLMRISYAVFCLKKKKNQLD